MYDLEKDVTLIAIDCLNTKKIINSFKISLKYVKFKNIKLFTSLEDLPYTIKIDPIKTIEEYSQFIVKDLYKYIDTPFCLVIQHDSWICNPDAWNNDWFSYDYVGSAANWSGGGNGGFSLRSKKLLILGSQIIEHDKCHPEDTALASDIPKYNGHRAKLEQAGLKFAPSNIQVKFGIDCGIWNGQFGQHKCNLINWKSEDRLPDNSGVIYDCFMLYDEFDVLDIRLHEMCNVVEKFIIVEADHTHSGNPKPSYYLEKKDRFSEFKNKIIHKVVQLPYVDNPWGNENYQRDQIFDALVQIEADDDDVIIISDVDEIPNRRRVIENLGLINSKDIVGMKQNKYNYKLNLLGDEYWDKGFITRLRHIKDGISHIRMNHEYHSAIDCGWHFSWLGDLEKIKGKIRAYAHQELNNDGFMQVVEECYNNGRYLIGGRKLRAVNIDLSFPEYVRNNLELFIDLIYKI